jgi:hypothetical protein
MGGRVGYRRGMTGSPAPRHDAPVGQPGSRRVGNLSQALRDAMAVGPLTRGEAAGIAAAALVVLAVAIVGAAIRLDWLLQTVIAIALGTIVGTEVAKRAIPRPIRRAIEAFGYLGEWELDRAGDVGAGPVGSQDAADRWLAANPERPETRWFRWELLLLVDRPDEAAAVADRMPETTPYERFERAYAIDRVAWSQGAPGDLEGLRALAEAAGPPGSDDRRHAEVAIAVAEGKDLAAAGRDPVPPLAAARDGLPADLGLGRRYVTGLRSFVLIASVVAAVVAPVVITFVRAALGATG